MAYTFSTVEAIRDVPLGGRCIKEATYQITGNSGATGNSQLTQAVANGAPNDGTTYIKPVHVEIDILQHPGAVDYIKVVDYASGTTTTHDLAASASGAGITAAFQLLPDTAPEAGDAAYFGSKDPFSAVTLAFSQAGAHAGANGAWWYYNGTTWAALTVGDFTDGATAVGGANNGKEPFERDGSITWTPPSDWATTAVDSVTAYWVRYLVSATNAITEPIVSRIGAPVQIVWQKESDSSTAATSQFLFSPLGVRDQLTGLKVRMRFHYDHYAYGGVG